MNLPVIFKPIYVNYTVKATESKQYNEDYKGLWVDGGMLNNYPIHAFDKFDYNNINGGFNFLTDSNYSDYLVASNTVASDVDFNEKIVGFRLIDFSNTKDVDEKSIFNKDEYFNIFPYILDLLATFMYSGGQGQIRNLKEQGRTIYVNSQELGLVDFSPLRQEFSFGEGNSENININIAKEHRIIEAYENVKKVIT